MTRVENRGRRYSAVDYLRAGICTATLPVIASLGLHWAFPWACDVEAWLCILPLLLIYLAPCAVLVLSVIVLLNQRLTAPFPLSWVIAAGFSGAVSQAAVSVTAYFIFEPYVRQMNPPETLMLPHGFVAGAILGTVYWITLAYAKRPAT